MKKLFITLGAFFIAIIILGVAYRNQGLINQDVTYDSSISEDVYVAVNAHAVRVELADTNAKKARGLSERKYLGVDDGMLFDLRNDSYPHTFWMKDMLIPIDIIWINNGKIIQINEEVQPPLPNTPDDKLEKVGVTEKVDYVLEVNAGYAKTHDIKEGDPFKFIEN
jgi:uncharacterized membrane protein (UPF0127 family)